MSKEFVKRIITSGILLIILLSCLFINQYSWLFLIIAVSIISLYEIINIGRKILLNNLFYYIFNVLSFLYLTIFIFTSYHSKLVIGEIGILYILSICILSDIGGYVVGKLVGGKKLTRISPNKTISGSIGSFLFSLLPLLFVHKVFMTSIFINLIFCLAISLTSQLGDLFISYFKRLAKVKDTGKFLPGHGGFLDRIDGIIFAVPIAFLLWIMIIY